MNTPRSRLSPGNPWLPSKLPSSRQPTASPLPAKPMPPGVAARSARPGATVVPDAPTMSGVEVSEVDSDTLFDRFFGPQAPSKPGRR